MTWAWTWAWQFPKLFLINFSTACTIGIQDNDEVVITGGYGSDSSRTPVYNNSGFVRNYPGLNTNRYYHACAHFLNNDGNLVRNTKSLSVSNSTFTTGASCDWWKIHWFNRNLCPSLIRIIMDGCWKTSFASCISLSCFLEQQRICNGWAEHYRLDFCHNYSIHFFERWLFYNQKLLAWL